MRAANDKSQGGTPDHDAPISSQEIQQLVRRHRWLVAGTLISSKTIRVEPALNITYDQLNFVLEKMEIETRKIAQRFQKDLKILQNLLLQKDFLVHQNLSMYK